MEITILERVRFHWKGEVEERPKGRYGSIHVGLQGSSFQVEGRASVNTWNGSMLGMCEKQYGGKWDWSQMNMGKSYKELWHRENEILDHIGLCDS